MRNVKKFYCLIAIFTLNFTMKDFGKKVIFSRGGNGSGSDSDLTVFFGSASDLDPVSLEDPNPDLTDYVQTHC